MKTSVKDGFLYLDEGKLELYLPVYYLEHKLAYQEGNIMNSFGLMSYKYYQKFDSKEPTKIGTIGIPSMTVFFPSNIIQNITTKITPDSPENTYYVLEFTKGDKITSMFVRKDADNIVTYMNLLLAGKIEGSIPYTEIDQLFIKTMTMNGADLGVPGTVIELIVAQLCRDGKDKGQPFSKTIGKNPNVPPRSYRTSNIRSICASNSVFAALSFEDMNAMLDSSINMTAKEKEQNISPIENIIKM